MIGAPEMTILLLAVAVIAVIVVAIVLPITLSSKRRVSTPPAWMQCPACGVMLSAEY